MIENNPISSLSSKPAEELQPAELKKPVVEQQHQAKMLDKVELSDKARLLSKATAAMQNSSEIENDRVETISRQIQEGIYQVPVSKLASVLLERLYNTK